MLRENRYYFLNIQKLFFKKSYNTVCIKKKDNLSFFRAKITKMSILPTDGNKGFLFFKLKLQNFS